MNRRRLLFAAAALPVAALAAPRLLGGAQAQAAGGTLDRIRKDGVIKVGMTGDYFPYSFRDVKTNAFQGYEVEVATRLAADLGVRLELVQTTWPTLVAGLRARKYDISATGITITPERARAVAFSRSYLKPAFVAVVRRADIGKYASWRDLDKVGQVVALQQGTAAETAARAVFKTARLSAVMEPVIDFTEVLAGRADATVTDNLYFASKIEVEYPQLAMVGGDVIAETDNGIMLRQGDDALKAWIDAWVEARAAEGFFDRLYQTWFTGKVKQ